LRGSIRTDSASVELLEALLPVSNGSGRLEANLDIGGTWSQPEFSGPIRVQNGDLRVDSLGIRLRGIDVDMALHGHSDSLHITKFIAWSGQTQSDAVSVAGYVLYDKIERPYFNLRMTANNFRAIDRRSLARIDFSTQPGNELRFQGEKNPSLKGGIIVTRGTIWLPDPAISRKQLSDLALTRDTAVAEASLSPKSALLGNVLSELRLTLGEEVFLRSAEANIKLAGDLDVLIAPTSQSALSNDSTSTVFLEGQVRAERGTYSLALDPTGLFVRREFQVEGGTITFFGAAGLDPELNISALHTVRTANGDDIRIRVRLTGPLYPNPVVTLESAESFPLSQSDMVSYMLFGQPNFELSQRDQAFTELGLRTINPVETLVSQVSGRIVSLAPVLGEWGVRLSTATDWGVLLGGASDANGNRFTEAVRTTRVGAERQISEKWFFSLSTPFCSLPDFNTEGFTGLSGKLEFRFNPNSSIRAGKEPSALMCGRTASRVVQTPSQWGLSYFKSWRF
jgi:translocation and assembly module TamB